MTFNSMEFVIALLVVLGLHWLVAPRWRNTVLLAASYGFYAWWDWRFLGLLMLSTLVDFHVAGRLGSLPRDALVPRRRLLVTSLAVNLGILGAFKYAGFFVGELEGVLADIGLQANPALLDVVVPVGISFYTFQTLAYTIDVHRGRLEPVTRLRDFATYVAYFPQLVAGPIERAQHLMPQLLDVHRRPPTGDRAKAAASLIAVGLFRKVVLADGMAPIVNEAFADVGAQSGPTLALAVLAFSVQIYADFSGYSTIARGVSLLFGVELSVNFREPYLSRSVTEFWQRWHITLSSWLRDYLYIPLGGNRRGPTRTAANLMVTMVLAGLWHGAGWTYLVWGALHGLALVVERALGRGRDGAADRVRAAQVPAVVATFLLVNAAWPLFRATSLADAVEVHQRIWSLAPGGLDPLDAALVGLAVGATLLVDLLRRRQGRRDAVPVVRGPVRTGVAAAVILLGVLVFSGGAPEPFIYFQF